MTKSTPSSTAQPSCSVYMARTVCPVAGSSGSFPQVLQTSPASSASPHPAGQPHRLPVHRLQVALAAHVTQLLPVRVVGQRHHHVRARAQELAMQLTHGVRVVEYHLGHERARLDVAAPLQLEDVALGAEYWPGRQPVHDRRAHAPLQFTHETTPSANPPNLRDLAGGWRTAYSGVSIWAAGRALLRRSCS